MDKFMANKTINGTFGELWIDDYYLAEVTGLEAKVSFDKSEINQTRTLAKGYKITGVDCKGTVKFNKVSSYFQTKFLDEVKKGKTPTCTIISKLDDPDAYGAERVKLSQCIFDEIPLANWEAKKVVEDSIPFTFGNWDFLDTINE